MAGTRRQCYVTSTNSLGNGMLEQVGAFEATMTDGAGQRGEAIHGGFDL